MDWQDVLSWVVFLLVVVFSKKRKPAEDNVPSPTEPEMEAVRKKIEALKRQRNKKPQESVRSHEDSVKEHPLFSAYNHLANIEMVEPKQMPTVVPFVSVKENSNVALKSVDLPQKKAKLRDWVVGQVVLGTPAYKRYGNFAHR